MDSLLCFLNTQRNNVGIPQGSELWFFTKPLAYKVWIYDSKFFVTRISRSTPAYYYPEWLPLLDSGSIAEVLAILQQEPIWLTPAQVATIWAGQNYCELRNVSAG
jgi:hypothetical protein